jgi:hypothetical protein
MDVHASPRFYPELRSAAERLSEQQIQRGSQRTERATAAITTQRLADGFGVGTALQRER